MESAPSCHSGSLPASQVPSRFALKRKRNHFLPERPQVLASCGIHCMAECVESSTRSQGAPIWDVRLQIWVLYRICSSATAALSSLLTGPPASSLFLPICCAQRSSLNSLEHGADHFPLLKGCEVQEQTQASAVWCQAPRPAQAPRLPSGSPPVPPQTLHRVTPPLQGL